ncbi:hypothetical protein RugamoR57_48730 [Duganella caerulea]
MTTVYGPGVEPGGMELDNETLIDACKECGGPICQYRFWETLDGGCINRHWSVYCPDCGFEDSDPYADPL